MSGRKNHIHLDLLFVPDLGLRRVPWVIWCWEIGLWGCFDMPHAWLATWAAVTLLRKYSYTFTSSSRQQLRTPLLITSSQFCGITHVSLYLFLRSIHWGPEKLKSVLRKLQIIGQISTKPPQPWLAGISVLSTWSLQLFCLRGRPGPQVPWGFGGGKRGSDMLRNVIFKNILMFLVFRIPASGNVYFYFWSLPWWLRR